MASNYDLKVLREQIANDTIVINAKKERLKKLQQQRSKDPNDFYRNEVINWSRASVTAYSTKLEQLEQKHKPTVEEKEVLQALNTPILLGDQLTDMQLKLQEQFEARFGKLPTGNMPWEAEVPDGDRKNVPRWQTPAAKTRSGSTSTIAAAKEASSAAGQARSATVEDDDNEETQPSGAESTQDHAADNDSNTNAVGPDQKGIYAALGLAPNAAMSDVKKSYRSVLLRLHPDRNRDDPDAAVELAQFKALFAETLQTEEKRRSYDIITDAELVQLTKRGRELAMHAAPR